MNLNSEIFLICVLFEITRVLRIFLDISERSACLIVDIDLDIDVGKRIRWRKVNKQRTVSKISKKYSNLGRFVAAGT